MIGDFSVKLMQKIGDYNVISLFCHVRPDFDSLASVFSMRNWIYENFRGKKCYIVIPSAILGANERMIFEHNEPLPINDELEGSLGIVLDTSREDRILTPFYRKCEEVVTIDHHPKVESFAQLEFIDPTYPATSQILFEIFEYLEEGKGMVFPESLAQYLYAGIITDTNNLMSLSVLPSTYVALSKLVSMGINRNLIHNAIFSRPISRKRFDRLAVGRINITSNGLSYFILQKIDLFWFGVSGFVNPVNLIENIDNVEVWCCLHYVSEAKMWKCSIRSKNLPIDRISEKFGGGGHKNSSAIFFKRKRHFYLLIRYLNDFLKDSGLTNTTAKDATLFKFGTLMRWLHFWRLDFSRKYLKQGNSF